jgi:hypothetical protein
MSEAISMKLGMYILTNMTIVKQRLGKHRLKAGIVEPERKFIASQRLAKHMFPLQQIDTE